MAGIDENTVLLIQSETTDGSTTFDDTGGGANCPHTITPYADVHHESDQAKFGNTSICFDAADDALVLPASVDWNFGTGNYTVDFWMYLPSDPGNDYVFDIGKNGSFLRLWASGPRFDFYANGVYVFRYNTSLTKTTWHHIAIVKSATNVTKLYIDGTCVYTSSTTHTFGSSSLALTVGNYGARGAYAVNAYIEEFRLSNIARWASDFTPPIEPYSASANNEYLETISPGIGLAGEIGIGGEYNILISSSVGLNATIFLNNIYLETISPSIALIGELSSNIEINKLIMPGIGFEFSQSNFNWKQWLDIYRGRFAMRFYFALTGDADGKSDLVLPISTFNYRLRQSTPSYLQVTVPGVAYAQDIADRSNGDMRIEMAYLVDGVEHHREVICEIDLESIGIYQGGKNQSINLMGHRMETHPPKIVTLEGVTYFSEYNAIRRIRCAFPDMYLKPGDTAKYEDETFTVGDIAVIVGEKQMSMEIGEAES